MTGKLTSYEQETGGHEAVISLKHKASKKVSEGDKTRMTAKRLQNKPQQVVEPFKGMVIGQDWRVGADTLNIILYRRQVNKKTGKEYWRAHSYYATLSNALLGLVNQGVRDTVLLHSGVSHCILLPKGVGGLRSNGYYLNFAMVCSSIYFYREVDYEINC